MKEIEVIVVGHVGHVGHGHVVSYTDLMHQANKTVQSFEVSSPAPIPITNPFELVQMNYPYFFDGKSARAKRREMQRKEKKKK